MQKVVAYLRVSTARQGRSGLGLSSQRTAIADIVQREKLNLITEFVEVESGSKSERPRLNEALQTCRVHGAILIIAKLDRLSRDAHFLLGLVKAGVEIRAADLPSANRLTVGILAVVAEEERRMISSRTKAALQAARERGIVLGGFRGIPIGPSARTASVKARSAKADRRAQDLRQIIAHAQSAGAHSLRQIAKAMEVQGIPTARGATTWSPSGVQAVLRRLS